MTSEMEKRFREFIKDQKNSFEDLALEFFHIQRRQNSVYKEFLALLKKDFSAINSIESIPFMPVSFYKNSVIKTGQWMAETIFESSSTTGMTPSKHHVKNLEFYRENSEYCFNHHFGKLEDYCFFALLPSYLERNSSSLVFMLDHFIKKSGCGQFYKTDYERLFHDLNKYNKDKKIVLFGVTYALLEFAHLFTPKLELMVMETGGMKGRGPELPRESVHEILKAAFNVDKIYSEYGMAEMMSQAYSHGNGYFEMPPSLRILISDIHDPFSFLPSEKQGKVNIIDLANFNTCCFISTEDLGVVSNDNKFKILGRTDESDIRGCNLLYA